MPVWISHRGYKANAVENTVEAFRAALRAGFTAVETDLRLTADGHIVLYHDPDLQRIAGLSGRLASFTRQQLASLDVQGGARLLFLDEFFAEFPGIAWTFDIKIETGQATIRRLHAMAQERGMADWLVAQAKFLTWSRRDELLLKELFPRAICYARELECWRAGLSLIGRVPLAGGIEPGRTYALPARLGRIPLFVDRYFDAIHRRGGKVLAFLPECEEDTALAVRLGADEILTNGLILGPAN